MASLRPCAPASLRVPGVDSDDETKTPSPSPHHGRSRPPSLIADSSSESDEGDARGEVRSRNVYRNAHFLQAITCCHNIVRYSSSWLSYEQDVMFYASKIQS